MKKIDVNSTYAKKHKRRFDLTMEFIEDLNLKNETILNLGPDNPFSEYLRQSGFTITDTKIGQDLDLDFDVVSNPKFSAVLGFEILEHLVSPFPLLKSITAEKLVLSVPLSLWFSKAYWNEDDPYDRHYHEFEPRQLEMLLNKAGWVIKKEAKHTATDSFKFGIRPVLRMITPRYYFVYCERSD